MYKIEEQNVVVDLPTATRIRFVEQPEYNRYCLHLLYANPIQRGLVNVLEDFPSVYNTEVTVCCNKKISNITLIPQNQKLEFEQNDLAVTFTIPQFQLHQLVSME